MEVAADRLTARAVTRIDPAALVAFLLPAALLVYLALRNGGYDPIPTGEAGIAVWWMVLIGTLVGALPRVSVRSPGGAVALLMGGLAIWTLLSLGWTESAERTMIEFARSTTYLGFFVLGVSLCIRGQARALVAGVTAALGLVVILAALSRLEPNWFPEQNVGLFLPDVELESRLAYPINYSSGLAALCGIALPLLLAGASSARPAIVRPLAAAVLPVLALTLWLTGSSLAIPVIAIGIVVYLFLSRERIPALASLAIAAVGGAILVAAAGAREALDRGLTTSEALEQGDQVLLIMLVVCAAAAGAQALADLAFRRRPEWRGPLLSAGAARALVAGGLVLALIGGVAAGAPGKLADRFDEFSSAEGLDPDEGARGEQVLDVSARGRFQYWEASLDAYATEPLLGIGPGTFEFYWAREGDPDAAIFVRDGHSLYFEVLAELGPVGLLLVLAIAGVILIGGARNTLRAPDRARSLLAAATAAATVFLAVAAVDWVWELAAIGAAFLLLAGAALTWPPDPDAPVATEGGLRRAAPTILVSLAALIAVSIPFAGASLVDRSRESVDAGELGDALEEARNAVAIQPNAATPRIQEATVLELIGDLDAAVAAAREATERESTNWRLWIVLSRLEARRGEADAAVEAFARGQALFPRVDLAPQ